jgi:DNA polymerase
MHLYQKNSRTSRRDAMTSPVYFCFPALPPVFLSPVTSFSLAFFMAHCAPLLSFPLPGFNRNVTSEQKTAAAVFLDLAGDYLAGSRRKNRVNYAFTDDPPEAVRPPGGKPAEGGDSLEKIAADVARCERCELCRTRTKTVPGEGTARPLVMVIGEGPGADEDTSGRPFVGRAGQLLDRILDAQGKIALSRKTNCYIANVVKCRPPGNRNPLPEEIAACAPFLRRQIALLRPKIILAAGSVAARALLRTGEGIIKLRGRWAVYKPDGAEDGFFGENAGGGEQSIPLLPTFHPSALLRDDRLRAPVWEDMKILRARLCELDGDYAAKMTPQDT